MRHLSFYIILIVIAVITCSFVKNERINSFPYFEILKKSHTERNKAYRIVEISSQLGAEGRYYIEMEDDLKSFQLSTDEHSLKLNLRETEELYINKRDSLLVHNILSGKKVKKKTLYDGDVVYLVRAASRCFGVSVIEKTYVTDF